MKKLTGHLFSMPTAGFLLLVFAMALAIATFVENSYGSEAARAIVYNSWWLEVIMLILGVNLVANVFKYKLFNKKKLTLGIFHLALILIVLGAGMTRYFGSEGIMHIREGESSAVMVSQEPWFKLNAESGGEKKGLEKRFYISSVSKDQISGNVSIGDKKISVKSIDYIPQTQQSMEPVKEGSPMIEIVYPVGGEMQTEFLEKGKSVKISGATLGYGVEAQVQFSNIGDTLKMISKDTISTMDMAGKTGSTFIPGNAFVSTSKSVYRIGSSAFVVKQFLPSAVLVAAPANGVQTGIGAVKVQLSDNQNKKEITVWTNGENQGLQYEGIFDGVNINMSIGPREVSLPFSIALKKFVLERYPGSNSPSSYESMVTLTDKELSVNKDFRIFMNNVLKHRGYRFYQSSYDQDEKGTVLSVNKDTWGTSTTYLGYFFLFLGIILSIFNPSSFFFKLMKKISAGTEELTNEGAKKLRNKGIKSLLILCLLSSFNAEASVPVEIPSKVANEFSKVWVQGHDGRIKPFTTLAYEVVMKVSRSEKLSGQNPEQIILGMAAHSIDWQQVAMIAINESQLEEKLGVKGANAAFADFFDTQGNYKLAQAIQAAYAKGPGARGTYDNAVIKVDERLNVVYQLYNGEMFRFFPSPDSKDENWYTQNSKLPSAVSADSLFIRTSFRDFKDALNNNNATGALNILSSIKEYQQKYGAKLIPGESKGNLEIMYNHVNIFKYLSLWYILLGITLLSFFFHSLFTGRPLRKPAVSYTVAGLFIGFLAQCSGLIIRGVISGHMPWSNGYESMIYIAWAAMFAGLIFARRNPMVLGAAAILSSLTLFVAQMSWLNPELTNLVPVLKSYWLTIHVAIITASYGFLGVSAIIGLLNLVMAAFQNKSSRERLNQTIIHMTAINQAAMILGLYFLTIGTFLGGIWANESWGRYWGWDPKETWSLITILVYTFITHMRLIKGFRGWYSVNLGSLVGMISVLMTYLGVNYYLSGLHSYGSGEGLQFPLILVVVFVIVGIIAFLAKKRGGEFKKEIELQE